MDDIPAALRERRKPNKSPSINLFLVSGILGLGMSGLLLVSFSGSRSPIISNSTETENQGMLPTQTSQPTGGNTTETDFTGENPDKLARDSQYKANSQETDHIFGHLPYQQASPSELKGITNDGRIKLRANAAEKFKEMQAAAKASGVILLPISGFRSISEQEYLFFEIKAQRSQVASKRAEVSAPPGYSEHHTGYALDIGDGRTPATHLRPSFAQTAAYKWLETNAAKYSFELSFSPDNLQGVSYEPWHWRYVGDTKSLETFYKARNLKSKIN
jgi:D-alanyl-D-alanine carboxypeptidase